MNENIEELNVHNANEIDHRLKFDAFTYGIEQGGLRSVSSIYLIVCYIIANVNEKISAQNIIDTMVEGMIANYFEVVDAIDNLKKRGTIVEKDDGTLQLNQDGVEAVELIEKDLPLTIRNKSIEICQKIVAKETYQRENKTEIVKIDNGYNVVLRVSDKDTDFMVLTIFAPTITQAEILRDKFISNPVKVYENLINSIFSNEE